MNGPGKPAEVDNLLLPGSIFVDRYEIKTILGKGDRKRTYLAHDKKVDRLVAISLILPEAIEFDPQGTVREARFLGHIGSHDNVVSLYDYATDDPDQGEYMVFEYLSGGTLADFLKTSGPLELEMLLKFGRQLCRSLAHLHSRGIIHRDVSLANVWLDDRLTAHLGDFDSAIYIDEQNELQPITSNSFASPEELSRNPLGFQADLYSFGKILLALASGDPYCVETAYLRQIRPEIPIPLINLIDTILSPVPENRPDSAEAVLQRLDEIRQSPNIGSIITAGESGTVEFKESLLHPRGPVPIEYQNKLEQGLISERDIANNIRKSLAHAVTKTVAAFLNSEGGKLLIGVADDGTVVGIEDDFQDLGHSNHNEDGWQQKLREILNKALENDIWDAVQVEIAPYGGKLVAVVSCSKRKVETWHSGNGKAKNGENKEDCFYIRTTSATEELKGKKMVSYIRQHWAS